MKAFLVKVAAATLVVSTFGTGQEGTSLSLADAERIALENHPAPQSAAAALRASRGRFWRGIAPAPPSVSLEYSYVPVGRSLNAFGEKTLEISQALDFPLLTAARGAGLSSEVNAREGDLASARLEAAANAKLAYVQAVAAGHRLLLAQESLVIAESFLREAGTRKKVGEGTHLELLTARVQRLQAENAVESARAAVTAARGELLNALGWPPERSAQSLRLSDSLVFKPVDLNLDSLQLIAQSVNPQIAACADRLSAAQAGHTASWMSILPSLNLSYYRQTVGDNPNLYGVKFGISLPVWFLLDTRGQVQETSAGVAIATEALREVRNAVFRDVVFAFTAYANGKRQVQLQQGEILPQAEEIFRVASVSYRAGEVGYLEFLQALQALNAARSALLGALVDYTTAVILLDKTVGHNQ